MKRLLKEYNGVRLIRKAIPDPDLGYHFIVNYIYRVQTHHRFLGIPYWRTVCKTTCYKAANLCYCGEIYRREFANSGVAQLNEFNPDDLKDAKFIHPKDMKVDYENSK